MSLKAIVWESQLVGVDLIEQCNINQCIIIDQEHQEGSVCSIRLTYIYNLPFAPSLLRISYKALPQTHKNRRPVH